MMKSDMRMSVVVYLTDTPLLYVIFWISLLNWLAFILWTFQGICLRSETRLTYTGIYLIVVISIRPLKHDSKMVISI